MNYYEELGLKPDATGEEIRAAYKNLVRLLHPDQVTDDSLRHLAECQMRRLNAVYETLSDPVRRRVYDAGCSAVPALRHGPEHLRRLRGLGLALLGATAVVFAVWGIYRNPPASHPSPASIAREDTTQSTSKVGEEPDPGATAALAAARRELLRLRSERDSALQELAALRASLEQSPPVSIELPRPVPSLPSLPARTETPTPTPTPRQDLLVSVPNGFSGTWLYIPPRLPESPARFYTAEFVEVVITEESGYLRGRYRGRFRIPDRPISPDVTFRFEGQAAGEAATLPWSGPGGARGEVALQLQGSGRLKVDWFASELGTQLGLASGSALLTRSRAD